MNTDSKNLSYLLQYSTQVSNGLTETSADGACLAFDSRYGIMFCAYMPGSQGKYGESRGKIAMSCFPASQPTNIRFITVSEDIDVYCNNIYGLGDGKVRVFYEKDSRSEGDHFYCYRDYDFISDTLGEEGTLMVKKEDGSLAPLTLSMQFKYLEARGLFAHQYMKTEQVGHCEMFKGEDGYSYGAAVSYLSEVILYRSNDGFASVEFFAVFPRSAQYEFEYKIHNGIIYALYRTNDDTDAIYYTTSSDMGKSWSEPIALKESIQCRPRLLVYHSRVLLAYNYYNADTANRPEIQQGRTAVRIRLGENKDPNENELLADIHSKCGIVNMCLSDVLGDLYLAYSTSELALEYQNGNPKVRGKDAIRYVKLGDLTMGRSVL